MTTWDDVQARVRAQAEELPVWALASIAAGTAAVLLLLLCMLCRCCCCGPARKSQYEAISKDLEMEEKEFALARTLSDDEDDELYRLEAPLTVEEFNEDEMQQLEMLDAYRKKLQRQDSAVSSDAPLSPTAATTSHRTKTKSSED
ncbi:hypothetical protein ACHHYP_15405 [Achlya hypogyna]|uniref:Uncharacterized protein n=1 Tax=Achlya hypogyna TaxID=1202772 RepID=A0A1V9ZEU6_ACHHY|nr:hypothetical protein ACHHYP_15405 [Achlya hypogyna]